MARRKQIPVLYTEISDSIGEFAMIPKGVLYVPLEYQRKTNTQRAAKIARNWRWSGCGVLTVSPRAEGGFNVIDGLHRTLSASYRDDINHLPCYIINPAITSVQADAQSFIDINVDRHPLSDQEKQKSLVVSGDRIAIKIGGLLAASEGTKRKYPTAMRNLITADEVAFDRVWPIAESLCQGHDVTVSILKGLWWLESYSMRNNTGKSLLNKYWLTRLLKITHNDLSDSITRYAKAIQRSESPETCAGGIATRLKKGVANYFVEISETLKKAR